MQASLIKVGFNFSVHLAHVYIHSISISLQLYSCCSIVQDAQDIHWPFNASSWPLATSALSPCVFCPLVSSSPQRSVHSCGWSTCLSPMPAHHSSALAGEFWACGSFQGVLTFLWAFSTCFQWHACVTISSCHDLSDICFLLRVRSWTLCAQWTCHAYLVFLYHVPPACVLIRFTSRFMCSLTCTNMDCRLVSGYLFVPRVPFTICPLVHLRFSLMPFSLCIVDSSMLTCYSLSTRLVTRYS